MHDRDFLGEKTQMAKRSPWWWPRHTEQGFQNFSPRFLSMAEALFPVAGVFSFSLHWILSTATGNSLTQDMPFPSSHEATRTSLAIVWYKFEALALTTLLVSLFSCTILFSPCPISYLVRTSLKSQSSPEKKSQSQRLWVIGSQGYGGQQVSPSVMGKLKT